MFLPRIESGRGQQLGGRLVEPSGGSIFGWASWASETCNTCRGRKRERERTSRVGGLGFRRKCIRESADRLQCRGGSRPKRNGGRRTLGGPGWPQIYEDRVHHYDENFECFAALPVENSVLERVAGLITFADNWFENNVRLRLPSGQRWNSTKQLETLYGRIQRENDRFSYNTVRFYLFTRYGYDRLDGFLWFWETTLGKRHLKGSMKELRNFNELKRGWNYVISLVV